MLVDKHRTGRLQVLEPINDDKTLVEELSFMTRRNLPRHVDAVKTPCSGRMNSKRQPPEYGVQD